MSSYLSLILYATKADSDIFPSKCLCDSLAHTGFPGSRCTCKQNNRACILLFESHYRNLLNHSFLRLLEAVMALIKYFLSLFDIYFLFFFRLPAKGCDKLKIFKCGSILVIITSHLLEFIKYSVYLVFDLFRESCLLYFPLKSLHIREFILIVLSKLIIKQVYLPPDHIFSIIVPLLVLYFLVNVYLELNKVLILKHCLRNEMVSLHKRIGFKHCIFFFYGQVCIRSYYAYDFIDIIKLFRETHSPASPLKIRGNLSKIL